MLNPQIISLLVEKNYVLFAQKTQHGHKVDYPELEKEEVLNGLNKYDMRFAWAWGCASSPFHAIEDKTQRLRACIHYGYPEHLRKEKMSEFSVRFPDTVKRGIARMENYSLQARVVEYLVLKQVRDNIVSILATDLKGKDGVEKESYLTQASKAQKVLAEQRERIEGLDLGIAEEGDTMFKEAVDILSLYHSQS